MRCFPSLAKKMSWISAILHCVRLGWNGFSTPVSGAGQVSHNCPNNLEQNITAIVKFTLWLIVKSLTSVGGPYFEASSGWIITRYWQRHCCVTGEHDISLRKMPKTEETYAHILKWANNRIISEIWADPSKHNALLGLSSRFKLEPCWNIVSLRLRRIS